MNKIKYIVKNNKGFSIEDIKRTIDKTSTFLIDIEKKETLLTISKIKQGKVILIYTLLGEKEHYFKDNGIVEFRKELTRYLLNEGFKDNSIILPTHNSKKLDLSEEIKKKKKTSFLNFNITIPVGLPGSGKTIYSKQLIEEDEDTILIDCENNEIKMPKQKGYGEDYNTYVQEYLKKCNNNVKLDRFLLEFLGKINVSYQKKDIVIDGLLLVNEKDYKVVSNYFNNINLLNMVYFYDKAKKSNIQNLEARGETNKILFNTVKNTNFIIPTEDMFEVKSINIKEKEIIVLDKRYLNWLKENNILVEQKYFYTDSYKSGEGQNRGYDGDWQETFEDEDIGDENKTYEINGLYDLTDEEREKIEKETFLFEEIEADYFDPYWIGTYKKQRILVSEVHNILYGEDKKD